MNQFGFYELWQAHFANGASPAELASKGGELSDSLAWCFLSGYQASIRACFDLSNFNVSSSNWLAFAVSGPAPLNYVVHEDKGVIELNGQKSWIAACGDIDAMVVKAGEGRDAKFVYVPCSTDGLSFLNHKEPKILAELSQGSCGFESVHIPIANTFDNNSASFFKASEVLYFLIAVGSAVSATLKTDSSSLDSLSSLTENAITLSESTHTSVSEFSTRVLSAGMAIQQCLGEFVEQELDSPVLNDPDLKLLHLYLSSLKKDLS